MEFSTGQVGPADMLPSADSGRSQWGDVTDLMWPGYRRVQAAHGGDIEASWSFAGGPELQTAFAFLGDAFRESYAGQVVFAGRIHEMRLALQNIQLVYSLDSCWNRVACRYKSAYDGSINVTGWFEDTASQYQWGTRSYVIPATVPVDLVEAEAVAQAFLADHAQPRIVRAGLSRRIQTPTMRVVVRGWAMALADDIYHNATAGVAAAGDEIALAASHIVFVKYAADIADNARQVGTKAVYRSRLARVREIAQARDAQGRHYRFGAFGRPQFEYQPLADALAYTVTPLADGDLIHKDPAGSYVPAPLVRPDGYSLLATGETNAAARTIDVAADPRAQRDWQVVYEHGVAVLQGAGNTTRDRAESLMLAMAARRN